MVYILSVYRIVIVFWLADCCCKTLVGVSLPSLAAAAGTLALIAAGTFALTKIDEGFVDFMDEASAKVRLGQDHVEGPAEL